MKTSSDFTTCTYPLSSVIAIPAGILFEIL